MTIGSEVREILAPIQRNSLLRNGGYIMLTTLVTSALGYVYWVTAAHLYRQAEVGLGAALISAFVLASTVSAVGLGPALVQTLPRAHHAIERSRIMVTGLASAALLGLVPSICIVAVLPRVSQGFQVLLRPEYALTVLLATPLWSVAGLVDSAFIAERVAGKGLVRNSVFALSKLVLMIALVLPTRGSALGLLMSTVLATGLSCVAGLVFLARLRPAYLFAVRGLAGHWRGLLLPAAGHHAIALAGLAPMNLLPVLVAVRLSPDVNAEFYAAWMVGLLFFTISASIASSLFAEGSHCDHHLARMLSSSARTIGLILPVAIVMVMLFGRQILGIFGPAYARDGAALLVILAVSSVPDAITNLYTSALRVQRRLREGALLNAAMSLGCLIAAWALLPGLGIAGAGWAWLAAQCGGSLYVAGRMYRYCPSRAIPISRITPRNVGGFVRWSVLKVRHPQLKSGLFFVDRGADIRIARDADVNIGQDVRWMRDCSIRVEGRLCVEDGVFFNRGCHIVACSAVSIGAHSLFGEMVSIHDEAHVMGTGSLPLASRGLVARPIVVGHNVWVGAKATIVSGVTIGDNAVVGANSVVTRDVPAGVIVAGAPARIVRWL